jgi:phage-related holin
MTQWEWVILNIAWWISLWMILDYFWMSQETLIILTAMLLLDWIFGVINAYIQGTLESKLMVTGLVKKLTRRMLPFIVIAVMRWAGFDNVDLVATVILSILIVAEWYSVVWHIYSINYGEQLVEIDALKLLFQRIGKLFKWKLDDLSPKDKDKWNENTK